MFESVRYVLAADDLAALEALSADVGLVTIAVLLDDGDLLDVRTERAVGHTVGVADATARDGSLTADGANLGHF